MTALLIEPASSAPASASESPDLDVMSKTELLAYAAENGTEGVSSAMTKAKIIEAIREEAESD